jgi:hypothetical protein
MDGVGAEVDANAELVFHQKEIFITSAKERLKVGRDLECSFQIASIMTRAAGDG